MFDQKLTCHGPARSGLQKHFCPQKEPYVARKDTGQEKKNPKNDVRNIMMERKRESEPARWAMGSMCCCVFHLLCPNEIFVCWFSCSYFSIACWLHDRHITYLVIFKYHEKPHLDLMDRAMHYPEIL